MYRVKCFSFQAFEEKVQLTISELLRSTSRGKKSFERREEADELRRYSFYSYV